MEGSRWRWCQPARVDAAASLVRCFPEPQRLPLVFNVAAVQSNPLHKEVVLRGQIQVLFPVFFCRCQTSFFLKSHPTRLFRWFVQVASLLQELVEVRLVAKTPAPAHVGDVRAPIAAHSLAPSFIFALEHLHGVKVALFFRCTGLIGVCYRGFTGFYLVFFLCGSRRRYGCQATAGRVWCRSVSTPRAAAFSSSEVLVRLFSQRFLTDLTLEPWRISMRNQFRPGRRRSRSTFGAICGRSASTSTTRGCWYDRLEGLKTKMDSQVE